MHRTKISDKSANDSKDLIILNKERKNRAAELVLANKELAFQNKEKEKRAAELIIANKELAFQNAEKEKRAAELILANKELAFQNAEKEKRAAELIIANKELALQNKEKEKRAAKLIIANKNLAIQNQEKEKRAAELIIANKELAFQNKEKEKRAAELIIANKELAFQNKEKEKRAAELIVANKELAYQNSEKEKKAAKLIIANKELAFQNKEKEKRAAELTIADKELVFQNEEKGKRAAELIIADKELVFQNEEKEKRAEELIITNKIIEDLVAERIATLHESEERMNFFIDNANDYAIIFFDINGSVTSWNSGAQRITLYQSQEIIGQNFSIFFTDIDKQSNKPQQLLDEAKSKEHVDDEGWRVKKDGTIYWESVTIISLRKIDGTHYGFVKIAHDLTERKKAEEEIKKLNETLEHKVIERTLELEAANKELESFSYSVSHDLRAPLRHVGGFVDLLIKNSSAQLDETGLRYLNIISESSKEMGNLIDALLTFSRLGRAELQRTKIDSKSMVIRLLKTFPEEFEGKNIEVKISELPSIMGDESLINQVWVNLISNALKYSKNKEKPIIEIGSKIEKEETIFYIKDNGAGFDMKYADKLFGVFQRLHKVKDFEGVGIGLANVNRIVLKHGGKCWAEGEVGKGATFSFSIPNNYNH